MKRLRKRIISGIATFSVLLTMLPVSAFAANDNMLPEEMETISFAKVSQQGEADDGIQNQGQSGTDGPHILGNTEVTYPVEGGNLHFDIATGTITDCDAKITKAVIPATIEGINVTSIGDWAFRDCTSLTSVDIPDTVTSIGNLAFFDCASLTSVTIPNSVTSIGNSAFSGCGSLTNVTIGNGVTSIGDEAFCYCSSLTSVDIPDSVTSIGRAAFSRCGSLNSVTIGNGVTSIGDSAFYDHRERRNLLWKLCV